jgi:hypothetical protein
LDCNKALHDIREISLSYAVATRRLARRNVDENTVPARGMGCVERIATIAPTSRPLCSVARYATLSACPVTAWRQARGGRPPVDAGAP